MSHNEIDTTDIDRTIILFELQLLGAALVPPVAYNAEKDAL